MSSPISSVVDRHRLYADPDSNFHVDADPDPDPDLVKNYANPHAVPTPRFTPVGIFQFCQLTIFFFLITLKDVTILSIFDIILKINFLYSWRLYRSGSACPACPSGSGKMVWLRPDPDTDPQHCEFVRPLLIQLLILTKKEWVLRLHINELEMPFFLAGLITVFYSLSCVNHLLLAIRQLLY